MNDPTLETRIAAALELVRPALRADGGDVAFIRMRDDGILELSWLGACKTCPMSVMTLRAGVERTIMKEVPEVTRVEAVEMH
jgi:Fe-S cluster biogenesis protein NfuA